MTHLVRSALIAYLAEVSPSRWIGRTALMKFCYLLQTLRDVPLGYDFTLYSYGPFDSNVLGDLGGAVALGVVREELELYGLGYGYRIHNQLPLEDITQLGGHFLAQHQAHIHWVTQQFGTLSAAQLELVSTILYVDREAERYGETLTMDQLAEQVREVKPRFKKSDVVWEVRSLNDKGLLNSPK